MSCSFDYLTRSAANLEYNYCLLGFEFVLPVTVIVACYVGIVMSVRRQATELHSIQTESQEPITSADDWEQHRLQLEKRHQERKLAKVRRDLHESVTLSMDLFIYHTPFF